MADQDSDDAKLELPKLSLRRRKKDPAPPAEQPEPVAPPAAVEDETPTEVLAPVEDDPQPTPLFADEEPEPEPLPAPEPEPLPAPEPGPEPEPEPEPRVRRERSVPHVDPRAAAVLAGLVTGLLGVVLTYGFQEGCAAVKGTGSCGGIGLVLLIAVLIAMIFTGNALLKLFRVPDAMSTSGLAVGILAVVTVLFLLGVIDRWFMVIVIPLLGAVAYLLSWWVSSSFGAAEKIEQE